MNLSSSNQPELIRAVAATGLLAEQDAVLVMLSGGADSTCLVDIAFQLCRRVEAVHVNYGLRGRESELDELACREFASSLDLPLHVIGAELSGEGNLHAEARDLRYDQAERLRAERGLDLIAVAHTRDDQIETLLYRLAASPGRRSLRGMRSRRGQIVRPLLGSSAADVRAYLRERGVTWRDDSSNLDQRFARARIRSELVPQWQKIHPAADQNLLDTADQLAQEGEVIDGLVRDLLSEAATANGIDLNILRSAPRALARLALREITEDWAGKSVAVSTEALDRVLATGSSGSQQIELPGIKLLREYDLLRPLPTSTNARPHETALRGEVEWGDWTLGTGAPPQARAGSDIFMQLLRAGSVLQLRARRPGDRIEPIGMSGSKSLQDLFVDLKVPSARRDQYPVVCSDDQIAWIPGLAVSRQFAAGPDDSPLAVWAMAAR